MMEIETHRPLKLSSLSVTPKGVIGTVYTPIGVVFVTSCIGGEGVEQFSILDMFFGKLKHVARFNRAYHPTYLCRLARQFARQVQKTNRPAPKGG